MRSYTPTTGKVQRFILVTGSNGAGKTTFTGKLLEALHNRGMHIGGILTESDKVARYEGKQRYYAYSVSDGSKRLLLSRELPLQDCCIAVGPFSMDLSALEWAKGVIGESMKTSDALVIDELGPLELRGKGYWSIAKTVTKEYKGLIIFVIRRSVCKDLLEKLEIDMNDVLVADVETIPEEKYTGFIEKDLLHE